MFLVKGYCAFPCIDDNSKAYVKTYKLMASKDIILKKVEKLAREATDVAGMQLVRTELLGQRGRITIRVTIDGDNGISIQDCEQVSRQLEALLDIEDPVPGSYKLEVTSIGIDRPLKTTGEFERFTGRLARIVTKERIDNQTFFIGRIQGVKGDSILFQLKDREVQIPLETISRARLEIEIS